MHIDFYVAPPAPAPSRAPGGRKSSTAGQDFMFTGDQFIFTSPARDEVRAYRPPAASHTNSGFWNWVGQLFS